MSIQSLSYPAFLHFIHSILTLIMALIKGLVFDIKRFALHDGPGIRTTVFLKGCPLNCLWCHNPESKSDRRENFQTSVIIENQTFQRQQVIGRFYQIEELLAIIEKDNIFYQESGGGVTLSGGEPLLQHEFTAGFLKACKVRGLHTAVDTSGYATQAVIREVSQFTDLFLYDLKLMDNDLHKRFTGVDNHSILSNLQLLDAMKKKVIIRIPLIEKVNATDKNLNLLIDFLNGLTEVREIHLLPYHALGDHKHKRCGFSAEHFNFVRPDSAGLALFQNRLTDSGYTVKIGG
jgi:pyruvate formate lyase activating enzyme